MPAERRKQKQKAANAAAAAKASWLLQQPTPMRSPKWLLSSRGYPTTPNPKEVLKTIGGAEDITS
jgi:hypothetical protein